MRKATKNGIKVALESLATKSIRKACADGGISVTTLYNKTTPAQRKAALKGKPVQQVAKKGRGPGRPKRIVPNQSIPTPNTEIPVDHQYVAKLERALLKRFLDNEE